MKKRNGFKRTLIGYFAFFIAIAITVTAAVIIYEIVRKNFDGDVGAISVVMLAVCLGVSLFCTMFDFFRRKFTVDGAVEQILDATEQITSGNFDIRLIPRHSYNKYDDLDMIMQNLNQMADELSKNEVLKSDFISNVSHEIKTPLAVIQSYASALQNDKLDSATRNEYSKVLAQTSARLTALVTNVLKLNKLENQIIRNEMQRVKVDEVLAQTVFSFEDVVENKNIQMDCDVDEVTIISSPAYLEIIFNNLLSNAVKFTPQGGTIHVSLKSVNDKVIIKVVDSGIGMSAETGKRIFDKFYQGDTSHAKEGNGLGLALVKKVIDILGGKISVESELGKGSAFTVVMSGVVNA